MFIDEARIFVKAGDGGNGCMSFRREKHVPRGGPDGGDGGRGGNVFIRADSQLTTLMDMSQRSQYFAGNGKAGSGKKKRGKSGTDLFIRVPLGTIIRDRGRGNVLRDLTEHGQQIRVAKAGRGGYGNKHFANALDQTPRYAEEGALGEERWLRLELKLMADVGLIGLPNAGKSTLLAHMSKARPKIAEYPFTTLDPQLGIVECANYGRFVMADLPGLIEGAHKGVGLGDEFLKHIERTRILVHVVDAAPIEGAPRPDEAYRVLRGEISAYSAKLAKRPEIVIANKIDIPEAEDGVKELQKIVDNEVCRVSAAVGTGLDELKQRIVSLINELRQTEADG